MSKHFDSERFSVTVRNIAIAISVLVVAIAYGFKVTEEYKHTSKLIEIRVLCAKESSTQFNYMTCMQNHGFDNDLGINRNIDGKEMQRY